MCHVIIENPWIFHIIWWRDVYLIVQNRVCHSYISHFFVRWKYLNVTNNTIIIISFSKLICLNEKKIRKYIDFLRLTVLNELKASYMLRILTYSKVNFVSHLVYGFYAPFNMLFAIPENRTIACKINIISTIL